MDLRNLAGKSFDDIQDEFNDDEEMKNENKLNSKIKKNKILNRQFNQEIE
jgi:hypothetical protein